MYKLKTIILSVCGILIAGTSVAADTAFDLGSMDETMQPQPQSESVANSQQISPDLSAGTTSLTNFVQQGQNVPQGQKGTWLHNLVSTVAQKGAQAISSAPEDSMQPRSNASVFDISGVMLRMNVKQVTDAMQKRGYRKTAEQFEIPNFIRWRFEENCRNQGVVGYERTASCVVKLAQKNDYQYIQHLVFNNFHTKETMEIFFTSNFTGNKAYRITYNTEAANIKGTGAKADYLRNIKIYDFWKKINQKYGVPDNKEQVIWGLGDNKPYLKAATGQLILYDPMLLELDYTRMSREDQKFLNTAVYTF